MEGWPWDHGLTKDREGKFVIGCTGLYSIKAFDINGPLSTVFVMFRPTALSRGLPQFDADGNGWVQGEERKTMQAAIKASPTVIRPKLGGQDVKVWLNGKEERSIQFNRIPEYSSGSIRCSISWRSTRSPGLHPAYGMRAKSR